MKFRALITDGVAMRDFMNVATSLSKFSKHCVMRISTKNVFFIVSEEESGPRRPLVWCELPVDFYFKEYNVIGVSDAYNEIFLEFSTVLFARSCSLLKQNVKAVKIKLTNKESPCLTLEMELIAGEILSRQCVHDIPVELISRKHWCDYEEPVFNDFHVTIQMPSLRSVKNIVERMRNMSHSLTVTANKNGKLILKIQTNIVTLAAHFPDLSVESFAGEILRQPWKQNNCFHGMFYYFCRNSVLVGLFHLFLMVFFSVDTINTISENEDDGVQVVCSTIDIKKFLMFLNGMQLTNCKATCSIIHEKMVKLFMEQPGSLSLQIFLTELTI